jgi:hypothetical protein
MKSEQLLKSINYLETNYQIANLIQKESSRHLFRTPNAWLNFNGFESGPKVNRYQLKEGSIILEITDDVPSALLTEFGTWKILNSSRSSGDWKSVNRILMNSLGLKIIHDKFSSPCGVWGPYIAVTQFEGKKLKMPVYKKPEEYLPEEEVVEVWNKYKVIRSF